jgi:hypothetical protein
MLWLTVLCSVGVMELALIVSVTQMATINSPILHVSAWISQHKTLFSLWHILIITAIYWGWGKKVERAAKKYSLSTDQITKAKRFRYVLIGFVVLVDGLWFGM